jgi:ABC-2 type transport system ATP-binding protein
MKIPYGINGVLGPNGAGKTTLIKILTGVISNFDGYVNILNKHLPGNKKQIKHKIGFVPQEIALYQELTAKENLSFFGSMYSINAKQLNKQIDSYLNILGLYERRNDKIKNYSGGMKRRVNLLAGLLHNPELLILDEPATGIDVQSKKIILEFLKKLNSNGINIIYTSHQMEDIQNICSNIFILDNGNLIESGNIQSLLKKYHKAGNLEDIFIKITGKTLRN